MIPFIHHLNAENSSVKIKRWIFTEAQTGRGRLDTHYSYVNIVLKSYVEDGHDIDMEEDIFKALSFRDGLAGTTVVLVDGSQHKGPSITPPYKCSLMGSRETHELRWDGDNAQLIKSSGITDPVTVQESKLTKHKKTNLLASIKSEKTSPKAPLFVSDCALTEILDEDRIKSSKVETYVSALESLGLINCSNTSVNCCIETTVPTPSQFTSDWEVYPGNTKEKMSTIVNQELERLYQLVHVDKSRKVSAEQALQLLKNGIIYDNWTEKLVVSVPRIKTFFSMTISKRKKACASLMDRQEEEEYNECLRTIQEEEIHSECIGTSDSLQDCN